MDGIKVILDAMRRHEANAYLQEWGCDVLRNLASNDDNQKTIAKMGGIKVILDTMKRHEANANIQEAGCIALLKIVSMGPCRHHCVR